MRFKFSRCLALETPDFNRALDFYQNVIGLEVVRREGSTFELKAGQFRLFIDKGETMGPVMEFLVLELDKARDRLIKAGCKVVRWEGKGKCCFMSDPFGFIFNLYEEPEAFNDPA